MKKREKTQTVPCQGVGLHNCGGQNGAVCSCVRCGRALCRQDAFVRGGATYCRLCYIEVSY